MNWQQPPNIRPFSWQPQAPSPLLYHDYHEPHYHHYDPFTPSFTEEPVRDLLEDYGVPFEEDESWWDGAEEIDLTQPFTDYLDDYLIYEDFLYNNTTSIISLPSCLDLDETPDCSVIPNIPPPPDMILILPPPPVPPDLRGVEGLLLEATKKWQKQEEIKSLTDDSVYQDDDFKNSVWDNSEHMCVLCEWAVGGNDTIDFLPPMTG